MVKIEMILIAIIFIGCNDDHLSYEYYENGEIKAVTETFDNKKRLIHKEYYENGNLKEYTKVDDYKIGMERRRYYETGSIKKIENYNRELKKHGIFYFFRTDSTLKRKKKFSEGILKWDFKYNSLEQLTSKNYYDSTGGKFSEIYHNDSLIEQNYYDKEGEWAYFKSYKQKPYPDFAVPILNKTSDTVKIGEVVNFELKFGVYVPDDLKVKTNVNGGQSQPLDRCDYRVYCLSSSFDSAGIYDLKFHFNTEMDIDSLGYNSISISTRVYCLR